MELLLEMTLTPMAVQVTKFFMSGVLGFQDPEEES